MEDRIKLFGEYAHSRFDFDTTGTAGSDADRANWFGVELRPFPQWQLRGEPADLQLLFDAVRIGTYFRSPGAPGAPRDRRAMSGEMLWNWSAIGIHGTLSREKDNTNDLANLPRVRTELARIAVDLNPYDLWVDALGIVLGLALAEFARRMRRSPAA